MASLLPATQAHAGHDSTNTFHLGEDNGSPGGAPTRLTANAADATLGLDNADAEAGLALHCGSPIRVHVDRDDIAAVNAGQDSSGGTGVGAANNAGGMAVEGIVYPTDEELEFEDQKAGYGVRGIASNPDGYGDGPGVGVHGQSGSGTGVMGTTTGTGTGVLAAAWGDDGIDLSLGPALAVEGRARFSTARAGAVPAGVNSVVVQDESVTASSHISVTLMGDPGPRQMHWVERTPGIGFTLHLTPAPGKKGPAAAATPFTYLVVETGW